MQDVVHELKRILGLSQKAVRFITLLKRYNDAPVSIYITKIETHSVCGLSVTLFDTQKSSDYINYTTGQASRKLRVKIDWHAERVAR